MKVTKLSKGYRINVTETEMVLLQHIHDEGFMAISEQHDEDTTGLQPAEKRILTEVVNGTRPWLLR